jgi:hypothetical protein
MHNNKWRRVARRAAIVLFGMLRCHRSPHQPGTLNKQAKILYFAQLALIFD